MAFQQKKIEEHAFKRIDRDVKAADIPSVVILCGKEQYLVNWSINLIVNKFVNKATEMLDFTRLSDENITFAGITEACETLSMFSEKRVVVVSDFAILSGGKVKVFSEADENAFIDYVKNIPESTILILTCETPDKRKKLYRACSEAGRVYEFDTLTEKDLNNFIMKRFKVAGKVCKPSVISEFIAGSGYYNKESDYTLYNMENDLKKIVAHSSGNEVVLADVLEVISGSLETYIFAFIDSISSGRKEAAYKVFYNMLGTGESVYKILSMIVSQFELILDVKEMRELGMNKDEIVKNLGIHEFRVKKAMGFGERYQTSALRKVLMAAYDVDKNIKNGLLPQNLALEMLIAAV